MTDPTVTLDREDEERYLIGLLLPVTLHSLREEALNRVAPEHFGGGTFGGMWAAARRLRANEQQINRRNLIAECRREAGGYRVEQILDQLVGYIPPPQEFPKVVNDVVTAGKLRNLVMACGRAAQRAMSAEDFGAAYAVAMEELERLAEQDEGDDLVPIGQIVAELEGQFREGPGGRAIPSPWGDFNERAAGGFHRGRLYVIGGRPGDGKSIAGHQAAAHAAECGQRALIFSMEMGRHEVGGRLVANGTRELDERGRLGAGIDMGEITSMRLTQDSWRRYGEFADRSRDWPLWVVDRAGLTVEAIKSICRVTKRRRGLDVVCVDYLQLLSIKDIKSREQQVSEIARQMKNLARELDCAVLLPSQLNRDTARRGKPSLADLRESGGIEAHADVVVLLARQVFPDGHPQAGLYDGTISLDIAKNRFGAVGTINLPWRGCYASIG
jgi:replicative DNA helicase